MPFCITRHRGIGYFNEDSALGVLPIDVCSSMQEGQHPLVGTSQRSNQKKNKSHTKETLLYDESDVGQDGQRQYSSHKDEQNLAGERNFCPCRSFPAIFFSSFPGEGTCCPILIPPVV